MVVSIWFKPAWDYANTAGNAEGQALFSCEYVKALIERTSDAERLLGEVLEENTLTACGIRFFLMYKIRAHRSVYGTGGPR
jgi:hypothetical protein